MKKNLLFIVTGLITCQLVYGQPSFTERRLRDKTLNEGITHIQQQEYELAAASFTVCLDLDSTFAQAWLLRGQVFIEWGIMEDAMDELDMALYYNPALGEAYFYKGYILFGADTTGDDRSLFDRAISNGYQEPWSYYYRALSEIRDGMDAQAMNDLDRAIDLKEDFALAYHERAGIRRRGGDFQGSHFDYQLAIGHEPGFALAYNNMGSVKILMGDYNGAIKDYSKALELNPELVIALNNRGYARYFTGDKEGALQDFNAAITNGAQLASAKLNKASLLAGQGQMIPALSLLDETLLEHPGEALLYLNRGLVRELTGDLDGACEDWHRAIELGADEANEFINE
ncbi:MAG: tetratricopeptide repeat protein, partial [Bacteroidales bacterium]|nr:tetratricopeptide repeat protein [Bacteroidales bacterium]